MKINTATAEKEISCLRTPPWQQPNIYQIHNHVGFLIQTASPFVHFLTFVYLKSGHRREKDVTNSVCTSVILQPHAYTAIFSNLSAHILCN